MTLRISKLLRFNGETKTIGEWAGIVGISQYAIRKRLKRGWSTSDALTIPTRTPKEPA